MAKSGRHKKLRRQEKAKTQLTGVKRLAKAQNVIEPKLRAKKILLREQLKGPVEGEVATKRNQSLQDILSSLNHHNTNIKKEALSGLQEIITSEPEALSDNLDRILEKIASLTSDIEDSVRRDNLRLAEIIFAQVSEDQVKPFWNLLLTHVKCTLTNLSPIIRYSALSFISLLISYFPRCVASSIHIILPNILGLISSSAVSTVSPKSGTAAAPPSPGAGKKTQLKVEISAQHNVGRERLRVLSLISACLDLFGGGKVNNLQRPNHGAIAEEAPSLGLYYPYGYLESESESAFYGHQGLRTVVTPFSFSHSEARSQGELRSRGQRTPVPGSSIDESRDPATFFLEFLQASLPLLCETWLEVRPSAKDQKRGNVEIGPSRGVCSLPSAAVEILSVIVTVMTRLFLQGNIFTLASWSARVDSSSVRTLRKNQGQDMRKYFFDWLPFSPVLEAQKQGLTSLNLQLFYIAAQLRLVDLGLMRRLEQYVNVLISKSALDSAQTSQVLDILSFIHLTSVGSLTSRVLAYALDSGHFEAVNGFLGQTLTLGQEASAEQASMLQTIEWDEVVPKIFQRLTSLSPNLLTVLTFIALRGLTDLRSVLTDNLDKFKSFLETEDKIEAWDSTARLFYFSGCLESLQMEGLPIPEQVLHTIQFLSV